MTEEDLEQKILYHTNLPIPAVVDALRNNFWLEFDRVSATKNENMYTPNVYLGVCGIKIFEDIILEKPYFLAYIITQPPEYEAVMGGLLSLSTRRIRDFLNIPLKKPNGEFQDAKTLELVLKAAAMVDMRTKGGYTMRSETKNLTMINNKTEVTNNNQTYSAMFDAAGAPKNGVQINVDLDEEIRKLDAELAEQAKLPPATPNFTHPGQPRIAESVVVMDSNIIDAEVVERDSGDKF